MPPDTPRPVGRVPISVSPAEIFAATKRDGAVIVTGLIDREHVARVNSELDGWLDSKQPGSTIAYDKAQDRFFRRLSALPARSDAVVDVILKDKLIGWAALALDSEDRNLQLCSTQMLEVLPGSPAQQLHADEGNWPAFLTGPNAREVQVCCLVALTDFTEENGATRVIPGTHKTHKNADWLTMKGQVETVAAEMKAGDALFFTGKVGHGAGANKSDKPRRGMTLTFSPGWIRPGEAQCLTVSRERALQMPERMRELMGFRSFYHQLVEGGEPFAGLWQYEIGDASGALSEGPVR